MLKPRKMEVIRTAMGLFFLSLAVFITQILSVN